MTKNINIKVKMALGKSVTIRPYRKFRVICIWIVNMLFYYHTVKKVKLKINSIRKEEQLKLYIASMNIFVSWIIESFSSLFRSMVNSETENINFAKLSYNQSHLPEIEKRFEQAKFRVVYFLK